MDRILEARMGNVEFLPPDGFDALRYVGESIATLPRRFTYAVLLKADMVAVQHHIELIPGALEPRADGVMMHGSVDDLAWLARVLARLPFGFVIHAPEELRQALRDHAAELARAAEV